MGSRVSRLSTIKINRRLEACDRTWRFMTCLTSSTVDMFLYSAPQRDALPHETRKRADFSALLKVKIASFAHARAYHWYTTLDEY